MEIGKQYSKDDVFKAKARLHQSKYRANILKVECDEYGNMLYEKDGKKGLNFYSDFNVLEAVYERYGKKYSKQLYSNMLRSEHIPFNFFIPLKYDLDYAKQVLNELFDDKITQVIEILIEYAPEPADKYLNDRTSFDTYIKYKHLDNKIGIFGIEVKYTEQSYKLKNKSKEDTDINDRNSKYWKVTQKSGVFKNDTEQKLIEDDYRQIWRNHLLGESIKQIDNIEHFTSVTFFPKNNIHFDNTLPKYQDFLKDKSVVKGITFENYFNTLSKFAPNNRFNEWISYLYERYLID